uniref:Uncharacterized protein n=1 Tax=Glossina austeni TaxID=7395 RepID=A0A1A9VYC0_GLOAU
MFLKRINAVTLLLMLLMSSSYSSSENWKLRPTPQTVVQVAQNCLRLQNGLNIETLHDDPTQVRCFFENLNLWDKYNGFKAKRLAHVFNKRHMTNEIVVAVSYCNDTTRQSDANKWAFDAYSCFAMGPIGNWTNLFIKNAYKKFLKEKGL